MTMAVHRALELEEEDIAEFADVAEEDENENENDSGGELVVVDDDLITT
jgi:hypothetical protein